MFRYGQARWKQSPFLRLIIPLVAGIMVAWYLPFKINVHPLFISGLFCSVVILLRVAVEYRGALPGRFINAALLLFVFFLGMWLTRRCDVSRRADFAGRRLHAGSEALLRIREPPVEKPASWKTEADIIAVGNGDTFRHTIGRALLYFQKEDSALSLHYGDVIVTADRLTGIDDPGNPGAFSYKRYCRLHNIFYQCYLPSGSWRRLSFRKAGPLTQFFLACRSWCLNVISSFVPGVRERGVAEALLTGYRDNLDKELVRAYAHVGVVHIIAISGLHLGLIYLVLLFLLKPIPDKSGGRWLKGALVILALWCFTLITGAAPSALRASVMFSFFAIARFFIRRRPDQYNTLAASAFLLLCYNPFLLFDVGFQLSYLAVLGILIFQKPLFDLGVSNSRPLNYLWEMISVSLAAQLLIFPLALFYFHRLPVLFLIANLLIIPLSSFILYGEIVLLAVAVIPPVAALAGLVVGKSIALMNAIIERIDALSFSSWAGISVTSAEMFLLYGLIGMLAIWLMHRRKAALFIALSFLLCFSAAEMMAAIHAAEQRKIVVYNIAHHRAIDFVDGRAVSFMGDTAVLKDRSLLRYDIVPSRTLFRTGPADTLSQLAVKEDFIQYYGVSIALVDSALPSSARQLSFPVDYVLLSHDPAPDFQQIRAVFRPRLVIFDASNSRWKIEKWKTACKQLNLPCFSVPDEGAWVLDVK